MSGVYHARPHARFYGHAIGIIVLDCVQPYIPGDVGNASTFRYPVLFEPVEGLTTVAAKSGDAALERSVVAAAKRLQARGVKAISSNCGFLHQFQQTVSDAVDIPVLMSSLQQVPMVMSGLPSTAEVAVVTADSQMLTEEVLRMAVGDVYPRVRIAGLENCPEFRNAIRNQGGVLDAGRLQEEVVEIAASLLERHRAIRAVVLECALLPPYACAVHRRCALPVFDFVTMIDWLYRGTHPTRYAGLY